jgi:p-hydroxybenzoate 3-monooxygenase
VAVHQAARAVPYVANPVPRDLMAARTAAGLETVYEAEDVSLEGLDGGQPVVRWRRGGSEHAVRCDFVAGCDGFHGVCRPSIPPEVLTSYG